MVAGVASGAAASVVPWNRNGIDDDCVVVFETSAGANVIDSFFRMGAIEEGSEKPSPVKQIHLNALTLGGTIDSPLPKGRVKKVMAADWSRLPSDLLIEVLQRLTFPSDRLRCIAVCTSWQSVEELGSHNRLPLLGDLGLIIPCRPDPETRKFYSLQGKKIYDRLSLPVPKHVRCWGLSQSGWLITLDQKSDNAMALFNPVSGSKIRLPGANDIIGLRRNERCPFEDETCPSPYLPIKKAALMSLRQPPIVHAAGNNIPDHPVLSKEEDLLMAVIIHRTGRLAFARPSDASWTLVNKRTRVRSFDPSDVNVPIVDVIFFKEHFYAVDDTGAVFRCELEADPPRLVPIAPHPSVNRRARMRRYLVESAGHLFQVRIVFEVSFELNRAEERRDLYLEDYLAKLGYDTKDVEHATCEDVVTYISGDEDDGPAGTTDHWVHDGDYDPDYEGRCGSYPVEFQDHRHYKTLFCDVFRLDLEGWNWVPVNCLDDRSFFVGQNTSFSAMASAVGCTPNCIYFTDDYEYGHYTHRKTDFTQGFFFLETTGGYDNGIFSLDDKTIHPIYQPNSKFLVPSPIWYTLHAS